jgi:AcrR family transcriptional regulator
MSSIFLNFFVFMEFPKTSTPNRPEKTAAILDGAMQVFLEQGYAGTTMDRIASVAKVSKPTIYNHFQDKEALFNALIEKMVREKQWIKNLGNLMENRDLHPENVLRQFAFDMFACCDDIEQTHFIPFIQLVLGESGRFPELGRAFVEYVDKPILDLLTQYLTDCPYLKLADPAASTMIFFGTLVYLITTHKMMDAEDIVPMERDRLVDNLINLIIQSPPAIA